MVEAEFGDAVETVYQEKRAGRCRRRACSNPDGFGRRKSDLHNFIRLHGRNE